MNKKLMINSKEMIGREVMKMMIWIELAFKSSQHQECDMFTFSRIKMTIRNRWSQFMKSKKSSQTVTFYISSGGGVSECNIEICWQKKVWYRVIIRLVLLLYQAKYEWISVSSRNILVMGPLYTLYTLHQCTRHLIVAIVH